MNTATVPTSVPNEAVQPPLATRYTVTIKADAEWARQALSHNKVNRTLKLDAIARYRRDMEAGRWIGTGESIKFDTANNLVDGQNRLTALSQTTGVVVELDVTYNVAAAAQKAMDGGVKRTVADQLGFEGFERPTKLAPVAKLVMSFEDGLLKSSIQQGIGSYTPQEVIDYVRAHPDVVEATADAMHLLKRLPLAPSVVGFCMCVLRRIDRTQADEFMDALAHMRTSGANDPRYVLLRRLQNARDREKLSQVEASHYVFRAWNAVRTGQKLGNLKAGNAHGAFDFQVPQ